MNLLCGYIRHAYIDQIIFLQLRQTFQHYVVWKAMYRTLALHNDYAQL